MTEALKINMKDTQKEMLEMLERFDEFRQASEPTIGISDVQANWFKDFLIQETNRVRQEEGESCEDGEGFWMGKKIKDMSRLEIIKAWKHTDGLYKFLKGS